ncbi:MAG: hypothetical protein ABL925_06765 [Methylococcales bacterium]
MFKIQVLSQVFGLVLLLPLQVWAESEKWTYVKEQDRLTNQSYSYARSPLPPRGQYDNIRFEIDCKQNKLQFVIDGGSLVTSQDRQFDAEYKIDQRPAVTIKMKTFPDSKQKGYTEENVNKIISDILSGQSIFIRINTLIGKALTGVIQINAAAEPIKQVLADCAGTQTQQSDQVMDYTLEKFQQDFKQLSAEQQQQLLLKLKVIMQELN